MLPTKSDRRGTTFDVRLNAQADISVNLAKSKSSLGLGSGSRLVVSIAGKTEYSLYIDDAKERALRIALFVARRYSDQWQYAAVQSTTKTYQKIEEPGIAILSCRGSNKYTVQPDFTAQG